MRRFKSLLGKLVGIATGSQKQQPEPDLRFRKGDILDGMFEVCGFLGQGGFGLVLLAYDHEKHQVCALKTFRDESLADAGAREIFRREASNWVDLGVHPFVLTARSVFKFSNRLFVKMDFVQPDREGRTSLADFLSSGSEQAIGPVQTLEWAVQFCLGMEHAIQHGIKCHRDIKPQNILISNHSVKIADFGLALVAEAAQPKRNGPIALPNASDRDGNMELSIVRMQDRCVCGTPGYIPPEIFRGEPAGVRSDIYSFGLVLWQMAAMSTIPPFANHKPDNLESYLKAVYDAQMTQSVPPMEGPIRAVIETCLCRDPQERYDNFAEVRIQLEPLLRALTGKSVKVQEEGPNAAELTSALQRGISLFSIRRYDESLAVLEKALAMEVLDKEVLADLLVQKGAGLVEVGRRTEAIQILDQAIAVDPRCAPAFYNKGIAFDGMGELEKAMACYDQALSVRPGYHRAWDAKGRSLCLLGQFQQASVCCDQAVALSPRDAEAWLGKGLVLANLGQCYEAVACYNRSLALNPIETAAWLNKAIELSKLTQYAEAIACCDECIRLEPQKASAWSEKGRNLFLLERDSEAKVCYDQAVAINPKSAPTWSGKGSVEEALGNLQEATRCLCMFVDLAGPQHQSHIPGIMKRIHDLDQRIQGFRKS